MANASFTYTCSKLISWSSNLPEWQQDALRRILVQGEFTEGDVTELVILAKLPHVQSLETRSSAIPASKKHVQPLSGELPSVRLTEILDIYQVNALAKGPVPFGEDGLTVVYGGNATGKSGIVENPSQGMSG